MSSSQSERTSQSSGKKIQEKKPLSLFIPFIIVIVALIISTARDTATLHREKMAFLTQNQKSVEALATSAKQTEALHKLQDDLRTVAKSDPVAAKIAVEFLSPASTQEQGSPAR